VLHRVGVHVCTLLVCHQGRKALPQVIWPCISTACTLQGACLKGVPAGTDVDLRGQENMLRRYVWMPARAAVHPAAPQRLTSEAPAGCAASAARAAHSISNPQVSFMPSSAAGQAVLLAGGMGNAGGACDTDQQPQHLLHRAQVHA
jgi:hypothetical protein